MINKTEKEEKLYLDRIKTKLQESLDQIDKNVTEYAKELQAQKDYLWENKAGMDHAEKVSVRQSVTQSALTGEAALEKKKRLLKLMKSPWFGRFDFKENGSQVALPVYIGVHAYYDEVQKQNLIYDWRAPVSTMFNDFETGSARYEAPSGTIEGEIILKRQFRIREGTMEYMLESSLNIHDEILQQELSKASDDRMKNIVATIQRDQNAIIRNETSHVLIIQGVAGSGKTSIALHRIAFLLYRFAETLSSKDILILSPNKVFADYISNVLPELGEERIPEKGMDELAAELLDHKYKFQTFFEMVSHSLEKPDEKFRERTRYKASHDIIARLNEYIQYIQNNYFEPEDLVVQRYPVPASYIMEKYNSLFRVPLFARFNEIVNATERDLLYYNRCEINATERNNLRSAVRKMFRITNLRDLYKDFYTWLGRPEYFKYAKASTYEHPDVFPLIFLRLSLEGVKPDARIKHLLIDEMQDYTPVQYAVISKLFPGKKTILGDANQIVHPDGSSNAEAISRIIPGADVMRINKSYRSTSEIAQFAQSILPQSEFEVIERHGPAPVIMKCRNMEEQVSAINRIIADFQDSKHHSLGIVCKTQKQANHWYNLLIGGNNRIILLNAESASFSNGVIITTVHMSKGLEFDEVIIPDADSRHYHSDVDRGLLYIACTRAMHRLHLLYQKTPSGFLP
jgi:DNA helicase-2/ATP-dependent DNA helicase PcrA